jgi:phenylalanyl-tRNA synthetase beta chain
MKLSLRWLGRHVDLDGIAPERIRDDLTMSTAEIEGIAEFGAGLEPLVVGRVVECARHPKADRLTLALVDAGEAEPRRIVCGAPNVAAGQCVAVIRPGAKLPDGTRIEATKIRGEESHGMLCSERELGLSDAHDGILVLDPGSTPGARLVDVAPLHDWVLEIDNKSINHRPDLWGHRGFARELAAIYRRELRPLPLAAVPVRGAVPAVGVADPSDCPRYCAARFDGIRVGPSPAWLRWLLLAVGQRPISNVVDATNFVMLDLGQPLHAFDARETEAGLAVRRARAGETLRTLDGVQRELGAEDLLITAGDEPVALAGIIGGERSGVRDDTSAIVLESANFKPARIRRSSGRLGLRTDASARFEKSLDPTLAESGVLRFAAVLQELLPDARASGPIADPTGWRFHPPRIELRHARLVHKLGVDLPRDEVADWLQRLEFHLEPTAAGWWVAVPSFRATKDVSIEDDLIEEVGRMYRYDRIPGRPLTGIVQVPPREPELWLGRTLIGLAATELACHEVYDYSFVPDALLEAVGLAGLPHVRVRNPVAPEVAAVRRHVLPSTLACVAPNLREHAEVRLVEHGKGYHPEQRDEHGLPAELRELAIVWSRRDGDPLPELRTRLLGMLARVARPVTIDDLLREPPPFVHPGRTVALARGDRDVGYVGPVHPAAARALGIPPSTAVATVDLRALLATPADERRLVPIPRFPSQPVDVALLVPAATRVAAVARFLRAVGGALVRDVALFEVYRGPELGERKSLNFTVTLGAEDRTLSSDDEERYLSAVRARAGEVGAELRSA